MSLRLLLVLICVLSLEAVRGQDSIGVILNSARQQALKMNDGTAKVDALNHVSFRYFTVNTDVGIEVGTLSLQLATKLGYESGKASAYHALGANYYEQGDLEEAQRCYWAKISINDKLKDTSGMALSYHNLANIYGVQKQYDKALEYYKKAYDAYRQKQDQYAQMGCLSNMANVYELKNDLPEALDAISRAVALAEKPRDSAYMQAHKGMILGLMNQYEPALKLEYGALKTFDRYAPEDLYAKTFAWENIGNIEERAGHLEKAIAAFEKVVQIWKPEKAVWSEKNSARILLQIANVYLKRAEREKLAGRGDTALLQAAVSELNKAYVLGRKWEELLPDYYRILSDVQFSLGQYQEALQSHKQYVVYKDSAQYLLQLGSMHNREFNYYADKHQADISAANAQIELSRKENELLVANNKLKDEQRKKVLLYSIIAFAAVTLVFLFLFYRNRIRNMRLENQLQKEKTEMQIKEAQYQHELNELTLSSIRSQMNPHFIFNALNTVQSHIYTRDKDAASEMLVKFSSLIRDILDNSRSKLISLKKEIDTLMLYIEIEKERFGDAFYAQLDIDNEIDAESILIPPMLLQPYVENSIKHGLLHLQSDKKLYIRISQKAPGFLVVTIDDNGIGRKASMALNTLRPGEYKSFATSANEKRLLLLNRGNTADTVVEFVDKEDAAGMPCGTTVQITIPYTQEN